MGRSRRGRHEGTVRKRSADGLWEARREAGIAADGRRLQIYAYGKTKTEALDKLTKKMASGVRPGADKTTLAEYISGWLAEVQMKNAYATYSVREAVCRKHVLQYIGGVKLQRLQTYHITDLLLRLQRAGVGASTLRLVHTTLSAALNVAVHRKVLQTNPVSDVPKPRAPRKPIKPWSAEEAKTFLKAAGCSPYYALFVLALTTGMRQGELFALQWEDVDLHEGRLRVCRSLAEGKNGVPIFKEPKTASSVRQIELSGLAVSALTAHSEIQRHGNLVFTLLTPGEN